MGRDWFFKRRNDDRFQCNGGLVQQKGKGENQTVLLTRYQTITSHTWKWRIAAWKRSSGHRPPRTLIYLAFQVQFQRRLGRQPILLAFGTRIPHHLHLTHHDDKTTVMFDFSGGSASAVTGKSSQTKRSHGILGIFGWGLILPMGAIIARYLKHKDPLWYYLHAVIQLVGFVFVLATVLLGTQLFDKTMKNAQAHRCVGIFALVLCILQILAFFLKPNKEAKIRRYWNWYHHWFGKMALFFGAFNIVLGMQIGYVGTDWKSGYGFLLGTILIAVIVLEILMRMKNSREKSVPPLTSQINTVPPTL